MTVFCNKILSSSFSSIPYIYQKVLQTHSLRSITNSIIFPNPKPQISSIACSFGFSQLISVFPLSVASLHCLLGQFFTLEPKLVISKWWTHWSKHSNRFHIPVEILFRLQG
jgi:hypothetical protein